MTVLTVCRAAAKPLKLETPSAVMSATDQTGMELARLVTICADRILKAHEWQLLKTQKTYTGDGATEDFALPTDYDRMLKKAQLWSSSLSTALRHIDDDDEWLGLDVQAFDHVINAWIIYGGQMHIKPALATGVTAKHWYISNKIVTPNGGGAAQATFTNDGDTFRLSETLLQLGIIWQFKADQGVAYAEDQENYEELKEKLISDDKGSRIITLGNRRVPVGVTTAYPQAIVP